MPDDSQSTQPNERNESTSPDKTKDNLSALGHDILKDNVTGAEYFFRFWAIYKKGGAKEKRDLIKLVLSLLAFIAIAAIPEIKSLFSRGELPTIAVSGTPNSPVLITSGSGNPVQKVDYSAKSYQAAVVGQLVAQGASIENLYVYNNNSSSNSPTEELHQWINTFSNRLSETTNEIQLTKTDIRNLTALLTRLDERTEDIRKLPDGRTQLGYVVVGRPYQVIKYFDAVVQDLIPNRMDFTSALGNSLKAIEIMESSKTGFESNLGNVSVTPEYGGQIYKIAAVCEMYFGSNEMAVAHAEKAVSLNFDPMNNSVLMNALINSAIVQYLKSNYLGCLALDSRAIKIYETNGVFDTNFVLTPKLAIIGLYERAMICSQQTGQTKNLFSYAFKLSEIDPKTFPHP